MDIFKKIRLISKSGFLASSLFNIGAMNNNVNLDELIKENEEKNEPCKCVSKTDYDHWSTTRTNDIIMGEYKLDESKYYDFFSNIYVKKLDISILDLNEVKFNYFLNNSTIDEIIISEKNFIKQKLDYWNRNLRPAAVINKITIILGERKIEYINEFNENYDLLLKLILNNINIIDNNDSFEIINSNFLKCKNEIDRKRKNFVKSVNKCKTFENDDKNYWYELYSNRICQFDVYKDVDYIEINHVRTAGYYSGCGLFKNLIGEIYKRNGLIPIVLNDATTLGEIVYKKLGFFYSVGKFLNGVPIFIQDKTNLSNICNEDYRFLYWLFNEDSNLLDNEMILLPFKENVKKILKCDDEKIKEISKIYDINLNKYKNDKKIIYRYYVNYLKKSEILRKFKFFNKIKVKYKIEDIDESYEKLFTKNKNILIFTLLNVSDLLIKEIAFRKICYYLNCIAKKRLNEFLNKLLIKPNILIWKNIVNDLTKTKQVEQIINRRLEKNILFENAKDEYLNCFDYNEKEYFEKCDEFIKIFKEHGSSLIKTENVRMKVDNNTIKKIEEIINKIYDDKFAKIILERREFFRKTYDNLLNNSIEKVMNKQNNEININNIEGLEAYCSNFTNELENNLKNNKADKKDIKNIKKLHDNLTEIRNFYKSLSIDKFLNKRLDITFSSFLFLYLNNEFFNNSNKINSIIDNIYDILDKYNKKFTKNKNKSKIRIGIKW